MILPGLLLPAPPDRPHTHTHMPLRDFSVPHFSGAGVLQSVPDSLNYFYF